MCWILQLITAQCAESASNLNESNKSTEICESETPAAAAPDGHPPSAPRNAQGAQGDVLVVKAQPTPVRHIIHHLFIICSSSVRDMGIANET